MTVERLQSFALIGFGEAGSILGAGLVAAGCDVVMYDLLLEEPASRARMLEKARSAAVAVCDSLAAAVGRAQVVISAVTAGSSGDVARAAAAVLRPGQLLLDINSVAPGKKRSNARLVEDAGADYVEAAVMAPVPPYGLRVPMLLGGPRAADLAQQLRALGMDATPIPGEIGVASAVKMCRSVIIKGLESLTVECLLAARHLGAEREVLHSLQRTFPGMGWTDQLPDYLLSRVAEHGRRRAAEMREVARTLRDVGINPVMALATAQRQDDLVDAMASQGLTYSHDEPFSWRALVDALSAGMESQPQHRDH